MKNRRVLVIGAHPDDCEGGCGGTAIKYARRNRKGISKVKVRKGLMNDE
ncbi:MAG: hypothetical protein HXK88_06825 [Lachnospiraceae bacterium]|nr:hypothetical protein [Lachnospiraceae bacterium]